MDGEDCRLCGARATKRLFSSNSHAIVKLERPYSYFACRRCGVHFLGEVSEPLPADLYLTEKAATRDDAPNERRYVHWDEDVVRTLARRVPPTQDGRQARFLDFGSGWGHMLEAAKAAGYAAEGLDVSPTFAERARERSGCPVTVGSLAEAGFADDSFDVINAHFVLEYVRDLRETMREIARVLRPEGALRVCSYTTDSVPARLKGARWWNYTPTRLFLFSDRTIRYLAADAGLELRAITYGGEQSFAKYSAERPATAAQSRLRTALDWARWQAGHVHAGSLSLGSCRAFYLEKLGSRALRTTFGAATAEAGDRSPSSAADASASDAGASGASA